MARSWRTALATLALAPVLALTACSNNDNKSSSEPSMPTGVEQGNHDSDGARQAGPEAGQNNGSRDLCNDPELAGTNKKMDAYCNDIPWYTPNTNKKIAYRAGSTPHSTKLNGTVNVQSFLLGVMNSQRTVWNAYFAGSGVDVPNFKADIVAGSERLETHCPIQPIGDDTKGVIVKATSATVLYCPNATRVGDDQIAFPVETMATLWKGHDQKTGDLVAAIVASRAGGLMLNRTLALHQDGSLLDPYLGSSCLAGVWARGAYPISDADDFDRALTYAHQVMVEIGEGTKPDAKSLDFAWSQGYNTGQVSTCSDDAGWISHLKYEMP